MNKDLTINQIDEKRQALEKAINDAFPFEACQRYYDETGLEMPTIEPVLIDITMHYHTNKHCVVGTELVFKFPKIVI